MVDVVVNFGLASDIFESAPDFHKDVLVVKDYSGAVELGWEWDGAKFLPIPQEKIDAAAAEVARQIRETILITEVDPVVTNPLRWAGLTNDQQQAWADYRQALLDITQQAGFPHDIAWPVRP